MAELTIEASSSASIAEYGDENESYLTVQQRAEGRSVSEATIAISIGQEGGTIAGSEWYWVMRSGIRFTGTSVLHSGSLLSAVTLKLYGKSAPQYDDWDVVVVSGVDIATPVVAADYGDLLDDITSGGSLGADQFSESAFVAITLNAVGRALINKGGTTILALRSSRDISATTPKRNGDYYDEYWDFHASGVEDKKPKLTITYDSDEAHGVISIVETRLHYVDASGNERYILGTLVP